jgi:hypothetical protein
MPGESRPSTLYYYRAIKDPERNATHHLAEYKKNENNE